jgi:hypothetical protein
MNVAGIKATAPYQQFLAASVVFRWYQSRNITEYFRVLLLSAGDVDLGKQILQHLKSIVIRLASRQRRWKWFRSQR